MGKRVVLTNDRTLTSEYRSIPLFDFLSCAPSEKVPDRMFSFLAPNVSMDNGILGKAPYGLRKIEAGLLRDYKRDEIAVVHPDYLDQYIDEDTTAVGIYAMDPLDLAPVSMMFTGGQVYYTPLNQKYFIDLARKLKAMRQQKGYKFKVAVGGPGIWQVEEHPERFGEWGIDCLVDGEAEGVAGPLFEQAVKGEKLPEKTRGTPMRSDEVPLLKNPSSSGIVEITRGCGRGCQFCSPDLLMFRSIPKERIMQEVELEVNHGLHNITLHSEDTLFYGRKMGSFEVNHDAIIDLWKTVKNYPGVRGIGTDFFACSTIKSSPRTLKEMAEIMEIDKKHPGWVETGLETISPNLMQMIMPGKVKPYTIEQWPEVIDDALGILDDNHWITIVSMMTGLPKETEADVIRNMEFVDDIKHHNVLIWVFPLMPLRSMGKQAGKWVPQYTPLRQELILRATVHSVDMINSHADMLLKPIPSHLRWIATRFLKYVSSRMVEYLKEAEGFIETEDRLNLYKDLQTEVTNEGEAVMNVSSVVKELVNIQRINVNRES